MSMIEKARITVREFFPVIQKVVPERTSTTRREPGRGHNVIAEKNIPISHGIKREWDPNREIADLPAVVGNILVSGPTKTIYGSLSTPLINPKLFENNRSVRRTHATSDFRDGEPRVAMDSIDRGRKADRPLPSKTRELRLSQLNSSQDPEQTALDNRERVQGFHPSEIVAIDDRGLFGQLFAQSGLGQMFKQSNLGQMFSQLNLGQMFKQARPNLLGEFIEKKPRDKVSSVMSGRTNRSKEVIA